MKLNYELVSNQELTKTEKILLACNGDDFCFIRYNGVLKINKALPNPKTLAKIAETMWQFDHLLDFTEEEQMDELLQRVKQIAGKEAAVQLNSAWIEAVREKLDGEYNRAAAEWLHGRDILGNLDAIETYNHGIIKALWRQSNSTDAIFLYGYQTGVEAARKAVLA